jgi:hypothetical protein
MGRQSGQKDALINRQSSRLENKRDVGFSVQKTGQSCLFFDATFNATERLLATFGNVGGHGLLA